MGLTDVLWHDIECGSYDLDLPLWRELADREGSPVLDVGAGTGRVALDLARRGHEVVALDRALRGGDGPLFALPTYTAMLALRDLLVARGAVRGSFA